ncbi:tRNA uridine-5-carboxymethylaminomethyl(34) synthesis GTPase MnmE [Akkermansia glycaniphila]|uniref:tRNA modification GTPase MnmE n=1 Tax=Akkermansia glycaniphila TaxID=1679444 RepID=A0A1C7PEC0_9BACT|nr:tRNA uridine-5-carboxymethylaminomethyl(34) synthesis GTPase MnmE [Akkermansia glycaniphila]OCA03798.1 hypothetical protein AC781_02670 [Akkermansia glycaniphila]SEH81933.1 mnme trme thdf: trna modification gtpase trme [Akkermansia glycaniphila]
MATTSHPPHASFVNAHQHTTTIAALATAPGIGALATIRISGPDSLPILERIAGKTLQPRRATLAAIRDRDGNIIDRTVTTYYQAPASFTGENTVEITCHGGHLVTRRILDRILEAGAEPAAPGEYTQRAFLNGKLDLTQAEAVMDIISAGSDLALRAAQNQLEGAIGQRIQKQASALIGITAHLEAYIDFPEEDISPDTAGQLADGIARIRENLDTLLQTAEQGRLLREGIRTAIIGEPNVGKSSLLNSLLGYERAIVSDIAGTTRDTIEETVHIGGLALRLIDTAGIHHTEDTIEQAGIARTLRAGAEADLVLEIADATQPPRRIPLPETPRIHLLILNKTDLGTHPAWEGIEAIPYSCLTGTGKHDLEQRMVSAFLSGETLTPGHELAAINARHQHALKQTVASLEAARASILAGDSPEYTALDLREALDHLGAITGRIDTEDILTAIFSQFCLGK